MNNWTTSDDVAERTDPYQPGRLTRFFLWCSGSDPALLDTRVEYYRAAGVGVFVLLIAVLGSITFGLYASVVAGGFHLWFIPFAIFWGVLIFVVDRSIVVDPSYGNLRRAERRFPLGLPPAVASPWPPPRTPGSDQPDRRGRPGRSARRGVEVGGVVRPFMYLARIGMAIIVALLIAEVIVLLIFQPEIQKELADQSRLTYERTLVALADTEIAEITKQTDEFERTMVGNDERVSAAKTEMDQAFAAYNLEVSGKGGSGQQGLGPAAKKMLQDYELKRNLYHRARADRDRTNAATQQQIDGLLLRQRELKTPGAVAYEELKLTDEAKDVEAQGDMVDGWLAQERAFRSFQTKHRDEFAVIWIPWLVRVLLLLIDLLPLSLKLATGSTLYGRRLKDRAERIRYADLALHHARLGDIQHAADLHSYRVGMATRLHYEGDERYLATRTDHLRRYPHGREEEQ